MASIKYRRNVAGPARWWATHKEAVTGSSHADSQAGRRLRDQSAPACKHKLSFFTGLFVAASQFLGNVCGLRSTGVGAAMPIRSFVEPGAFDPEAIAMMGEALETALKELQGTGEPEVVRERIATRIIAAAKLGERDPARLLQAALRAPD
jgi:hypothetical protein